MFQEEATEVGDLPDVEEKKERDNAKIQTWVTGRMMVSLTEIGIHAGESGFLLS